MALTVTYTRADVAGRFDFTTNHLTTGNQLAPDVIGLADGGFVVAYKTGEIGSMTLDFYDANFNFVVERFPYDADTAAYERPSLTQLSNGNVVVVWAESLFGGSGPGVRGHLYSPAGTPIGSELGFGTFAEGIDDPQVAPLADGKFVVTFSLENNIYRILSDADGQPLSDVKITSFAQNVHSAVAMLNDGELVITYETRSGTDTNINATIYKADGTPRFSDLVLDDKPTFDQTQPKVAALQNGNFAVVYTDASYEEAGPGIHDTGITLQIRNPNSVVALKIVHVNVSSVSVESDPDITVLTNGLVLVTWTRPAEAHPTTDRDIYGRLFDQDGNAVTVNGSTAEFSVTGSLTDDTLSAVSGLTRGRYITSWQDSDTNDGSGGSIHSTIKEFTRTAVGDSANDTFAGDQFKDIFTGGAGNDTLVYKPGGNADVWTDFTAGSGSVDRIDLTAYPSLHTRADVLALSTQIGADTVINFGNGDSLTLSNVTKTSLSTDDFVGLDVPGSVAIGDATIGEGNSGTKIATFTVTRSGGGAAFDVNFATAPGSATAANGDYVPTSGTLHFAGDVNIQTISVTINGDTKIEPTESFFALLGGPTNGAIVADDTGVGTIVNDDEAAKDFSGDGKSDILLRSNAGTVVS